LDKAALEGLIVQITGLDQGNSTVRAICGTFEALKSLADFNATPGADETPRVERPADETLEDDGSEEALRMNLSYVINLVLPKTDDVAVFNAIFKSLREHLLRK
jgi:hypothetical protein